MIQNIIKRQDINKGISEFQAANGAVLLDVRTRDEYQTGHVPGSKNIDAREISGIVSVIEDKTTPIFVYCYSGSRSGAAVTALEHMGYLNVKNIGGIRSYLGAVEKGA